MPIIRRGGHVHLDFSPPTDAQRPFFTELQLQKLHRALFHPSAAKIYKLLKRADPAKSHPDTMDVLKKISDARHCCQSYADAPTSFKIRFPDEVVFNRELRMDLMFIDRQPILHIIDAAPGFQAAAFLEGEYASTIWNAFVLCWSRLFIGDPERITADHGSVFRSHLFEQCCFEHGITLQFTGTEQHNALGTGEKYHHPLTKDFLKFHQDYPTIKRQVLLQCAIFAMNTTLGPDGLVPCVLFFGSFPRLPAVFQEQSLSNRKRFLLMATAKEEYMKQISKFGVNVGLRHNVPAASAIKYCIGDSVYTYREKPRAWTGPHQVVGVDGKYILVDVGTKLTSFSISHLKPSLIPLPIMWTEVLTPSVPRVSSPEMAIAMKDELDQWFARGTFKIVILRDPSDKIILPTKFVWTTKHEDVFFGGGRRIGTRLPLCSLRGAEA
jgi:hypothetical protein